MLTKVLGIVCVGVFIGAAILEATKSHRRRTKHRGAGKEGRSEARPQTDHGDAVQWTES